MGLIRVRVWERCGQREIWGLGKWALEKRGFGMSGFGTRGGLKSMSYDSVLENERAWKRSGADKVEYWA